MNVLDRLLALFLPDGVLAYRHGQAVGEIERLVQPAGAATVEDGQVVAGAPLGPDRGARRERRTDR